MQRLNRINGRGVGRPIHQAAVQSEYDIPEFAALAKAAKDRNIKWDTHRELYHGLNLKFDEKVEIETRLVRYFGNGKITEELVDQVVKHNLFYICDDRNGKPVYEGDFVEAYKKEPSVNGLCGRIGLAPSTANIILRTLNLVPKHGRRKRTVKPRKPPEINGNGHREPRHENKVVLEAPVSPKARPPEPENLADYEKGIVVDAFSLNYGRKEAARRAGVDEERIHGLWRDLSIQAGAPTKYENPKAYQKLARVGRFSRMLR
jgi:hypothetical protein